MPESHISIMVGYRIAVIDHALFLGFVANDVFAHVEAFQWEVNLVVDFLTVATSAIHAVEFVRRLFLFESFQTNNEDWRGFVNFNFFGCLDMSFALVAVPLVVLVQDLWFFELVKAVVD